MTVLPTPPEAVAPEPDDPHINAAPEESDGVVPVAGTLAPGQCAVCANTNVDPDAANCETCGVPMAADTDAEASEANNADATDVDDGAEENGNINGADDDPTRMAPATAPERRDASLSFGDQQSLVYQALLTHLGDLAADSTGEIDIWVKDLASDWVVWHSYGTKSPGPGDWKLTYSIDVDGVVAFSGDPMAVVEQTTYEPVPESDDENEGRAAAPTENLVRFRSSDPGAPAVLLRDDTAPTSGQSGSTMFGYLSTFNDWYEVDSMWEGHFLEAIAPGAFKATITQDRANMRVLYDHGFDPQLGNKPIGPINVLREDGVGAYYEVPLLDTDYNRNFLLPALRGLLMSGQEVGSQLGASFRFIVTGEAWDRSGNKTTDNPEGLDLRTITQVQMMEFGPVTFPANDQATAGLRSACRSNTDAFFQRLRTDPLALARFTERTSLRVVEKILALPPSTTRRSASNTTQEAAVDDQAEAHRSFQLRARLALADF